MGLVGGDSSRDEGMEGRSNYGGPETLRGAGDVGLAVTCWSCTGYWRKRRQVCAAQSAGVTDATAGGAGRRGNRRRLGGRRRYAGGAGNSGVADTRAHTTRPEIGGWSWDV